MSVLKPNYSRYLLRNGTSRACQSYRRHNLWPSKIYFSRIISGDELNLRHLIGRRQDQISFYHKCLFNLSPYNQYLMKQWLVYHLNVLKFDLAQMTPSANETDKNLIKQLDEDYWDSEPSINGPDSAFRKYEYILTFFYHQLESYVNTPADLETPYWKKIRKFVTTNLFV
ncbi:uncharacterized protein LOC106667298 isoform X3 [Cimex lectularius]|uniref:Uncharacterized protein n=1 Tax=Cimex lectularius TaxID=79782 RepID=A0A8I6RVM0_CIMLE|nr:uncharacterized protein LOC106667298 isoform X3 [Cimex lectularius]